MKAMNIILGILAIVCGIVCISAPFGTVLVYGYVVSIFIGVMGLMIIAGYLAGRASGPASVLLGLDGTVALVIGILGVIFMVCNVAIPGFTYGVEHMAAVVLMAYMLVDGIVVIFHAVKLSQFTSVGITILQCLLGIIQIVAAVYGFVSPAVVLAVFGLYLGFSLILSGITRISLGIALQ